MQQWEKNLRAAYREIKRNSPLPECVSLNIEECIYGSIEVESGIKPNLLNIIMDKYNLTLNRYGAIISLDDSNALESLADDCDLVDYYYPENKMILTCYKN
jgi:hypothetical protein